MSRERLRSQRPPVRWSRPAAILPVLVLFVATTAQADVKKKPPSSSNVTRPPSAFTPKPDLKAWVESDGSIAIQNVGQTSVSAVEVKVSCKVLQATRRGQTCGQPFQNGLWQTTVHPKPGTKQAPIKLSPGNQTLTQTGPGWVMMYPAVPTWAKGTYEFNVLVDPANKILESDKANNIASGTVIRP